MRNKEIAQLFEQFANILQIRGENIFKINAYRKAARVIEDLSRDIEKISQEGTLQDIPGIGEGIAKKITEYFQTGKVSKYSQARQSVPEDLLKMMAIPGMEPKTVSLVYKTLNISTIAELENAVREGRLQDLPGMDREKEENILRGIDLLRRGDLPDTLSAD